MLLLLWFDGYDTDGTDAIFAADQKQRHPIAVVDFPTLFGNVEQPPFGNQSIEEREQHLVAIDLFRKRQRETDRFGIGLSEIVCIVTEHVTGFVFGQQSRLAVVEIDSSMYIFNYDTRNIVPVNIFLDALLIQFPDSKSISFESMKDLA